MAATLTVSDRSSRRSLLLPATVRHNDRAVDADIVDLSTSGFRALTSTELEVGEDVRVSWAGGETFDATVARRDECGYAFVFHRGMSDAEVHSARSIENVFPLAVEPVGRAAEAPPVSQPEAAEAVWPVRYRVLAIAGSASACWLAVGLIGWGVVAAFG